MEVNAESGKPPVGTPPTADEGEDGKPEMLTRAEAKELAERKIKAVARENKTLAERIAKFEAEEEKRKQADMSTADLLAKERAEKAELLAWRKSREEAETAELAEIDEENKEAIKALPKEDRDLVPKELPPKALAKWLAKFKARLSTETISVHGGTGRGAGPQSDEDKMKAHTAALAEKSRAFVFGPSKKAKS